jgi:chromate transporter
MLPGFVLVLVVATLYVSIDLGQPMLAAALLGIQVAVIALVIRAVHRIGEHILVDRWTWVIAAVAAVATFAGVVFWVVLPLAGLAYLLAPLVRSTGRAGIRAGVVMVLVGIVVLALIAIGLVARFTVAGPAGLPAVTVTPIEPTLPAIFLSGLKAGLLTFGGAYTAIPFVRGDAVASGWVSDAQFLDSLALSGVLPAPLIIFGTFVGFLAGGLPGGVAMTLGIFLPAFAFALLFGDGLEALVQRPGLHRVLEGVAAGVVGIIAMTALDLGASLAGRVPSLVGAAVILAAALGLLYRWSSRAAIPAAIGLGAIAGLIAFGGV